MNRRLLALMSALLLMLGNVWSGPLEDGLAAALRGDYARAFFIFQPLAAKGDVNAQFNLGVMNEQGQGVAQNSRQAAMWCALAAKKKTRWRANQSGLPV